MNVLRDRDFQDLLLKYPRPPRHFVVAPSVTDEVSSEWLIKAGTGKEYKPADYLQLFVQFVADNADQIEALSILLSRPEGWGPEPLKELWDALAHAPEHFTEANLQKAFGAAYQMGLADIISMVKRAVEETSPLYTAEERVAQAVGRVVGERALTTEQGKWMALIRRHLVSNLSIDKQDFDLIPVLAARGGWTPANRAFGGKLADLLGSLNRELVAA
jgi:type I restriction enzyme R subunit